MANDKDFVVNGPVVVGKDTKVTVGTVTSGAVDLSTGNYFVDSPSGAYTYSFTNPGAVQAFQIEATGGSEAVAKIFSTTLYTGNASTQIITNNIDLAGDGGLVWTKNRDNAYNHFLYDTERGATNYLMSDNDIDQQTVSTSLTSFNSDGFTLGANDYGNITNGANAVSWTFKKQAKFFDMVTYSGNSTMGRTVSHSFGSTPGLVIIKSTTRSDGWYVIHKDSELLVLNNTQGNYPASTTADYFGDGTYTVRPTSTTITVGQDSGINGTGEDFIAYIFGHDTADDSLIKCGSYTKTGSSQDIDLGWEPQWLLLKRVSSTGSWYIMDTKRGFTTDADPVTLNPNLVDAEGGLGNVRRTSTGFNVTSNAGEEWIYVAIRATAATDSAITWPTSIKWPAGVAPTTPVPGKKDLFTFLTTDGGTTYYGKKAAEGIA